MRTLVCIVSAFTIGAMLMEIMALRESRDFEVNQAQDDSRILEDEPGWDCKTMGNKRCK